VGPSIMDNVKAILNLSDAEMAAFIGHI
jgi:hypothetical protein